MRNYYFLLILVAFASCKKEESTLKVNACFDYSTNSIFGIADTIKFSNCSKNATNYIWDFGDSSTSTEFSPFHIYKKSGNYIVRLKAINNSNNDTLSKSILITDQYYTNLHDTSISPRFCTWGSDYSIYNLDIDKDYENDITITTACSYYHFSAGKAIKIVCHNGYGLAFSTQIDTNKTSLILPKEYNSGDIIQFNSNYKDSLMIRYLESSGSVTGNKIIVNYGVSLNTYLYFAFRNENSNILAWLKLNVTNSTTIILNSCRYIKNENTFKIE